MGDIGLYIVKGMYRNRPLLDLAHKITTCQNCGRYQGEGCHPAHSNLSEHGKGKGLKAHDCFFAALCTYCHHWLDNQGGQGMDPSDRYCSNVIDKRDMFLRAKDKTVLELFRTGLVVVA